MELKLSGGKKVCYYTRKMLLVIAWLQASVATIEHQTMSSRLETAFYHRTIYKKLRFCVFDKSGKVAVNQETA